METTAPTQVSSVCETYIEPSAIALYDYEPNAIDDLSFNVRHASYILFKLSYFVFGRCLVGLGKGKRQIGDCSTRRPLNTTVKTWKFPFSFRYHNGVYLQNVQSTTVVSESASN